MLAVAAIALAAAVAGGNLAVTTSPRHPVAGKQVRVYATGEVGDAGGVLYMYRNAPGKSCAAAAAGERGRGRLLREPLDVDGAFEAHARFVPRHAGRVWVCSYLYAITCDKLKDSCGPAVGLPPDAGFWENRVKVRPRR